MIRKIDGAHLTQTSPLTRSRQDRTSAAASDWAANCREEKASRSIRPMTQRPAERARRLAAQDLPVAT
jgi:hypothetical protein